MMSAAARTYANRFAVAAGRRIAIFTNNNDGWRTARDLHEHGTDVAAIIDRSAARGRVTPDFDGRVLRRNDRRNQGRRRRPYGTGSYSERSTEHHLRRNRRFWRLESQSWACMSSWRPAEMERRNCGLRSRTPPKGMIVAGAANGKMTLAACLRDGNRAARGTRGAGPQSCN